MAAWQYVLCQVAMQYGSYHGSHNVLLTMPQQLDIQCHNS